ncbi:hypothetical protein EDC04DRAFT_480090 [Pisolithus marmoratus]|nr:hypothetical protein EDC04DRAFT_480090 [Pisolithus marmoratus]
MSSLPDYSPTPHHPSAVENLDCTLPGIAASSPRDDFSEPEFQSQHNPRLRDFPQDEVETRRQGEDRQITFSHPENNEPEPYTFAPRPSAFGESRCDPSSTRNQMTYELAEHPVVVAHLQTDREHVVKPAAGESGHPGRFRDVQPGPQSGMEISMNRLDGKTSTANTRDKQSNYCGFEIYCCVCNVKPLRSRQDRAGDVDG